MGTKCYITRYVTFGGSMISLFIALLATCIYFSTSIYDIPWYWKHDSNYLDLKFYQCSISVAVFSGVGMLVILLAIIMALCEISNVVVIVLSFISVACAVGCMIPEGIYYNTYRSYSQEIQYTYNYTKNVDYIKTSIPAMYNQAIENFKVTDPLIAPLIPSWDTMLTQIDSGQLQYFNFLKTGPNLTFDLSGNDILAKFDYYDSGSSSMASIQSTIGTALVNDTKKTKAKQTFCWVDSDGGKECTEFLRTFSFSDNYTTYLSSLGLGTTSAYIVSGTIKTFAEIASYSVLLPSVIVLLSIEEQNNLATQGLPCRANQYVKGFGYTQVQEYYSYKFRHIFDSVEYYCYEKPSSYDNAMANATINGTYRSHRCKTSSMTSSDYLKYFPAFSLYQNVGQLGKIFNEMDRKEYTGYIYDYKENDALAQFSIAALIIQIFCSCLYFVSMIISLCAKSNKNEP